MTVSQETDASTGLMLTRMRLKVWGAILVLLVVAAIPVARAASSSARKGQVGGPPTIPVGKPDEGRKVTPAFVIGRGQSYDGPMEIVAYGMRDSEVPGKEYCVLLEYLTTQDVEFGICGVDPREPLSGNNEIQIDSQIQLISPKRLRWSEVGGRVAPNVAQVRVTFHRHGSSKLFHSNAIVAQVSGALQQKLGQPVPFGFFDARVRGLAPSRSFHVQALDANGNVVGSDNHPLR
jgi:hypothetical protein